jgi:hypothetical protein
VTADPTSRAGASSMETRSAAAGRRTLVARSGSVPTVA